MELSHQDKREVKPALTTSRGGRTVVLLSGGVDSAASTAFYLAQSHRVEAMFVDYGQAAAADEARAACALAAYFSVSLHSIKLHGSRPKSEGLIYGRNAFLYFLPLLEFSDGVMTVATGIHSGTHYWDCSEEFLMRVQQIFDQYTDGRVQAAAPFVLWSKRQIWDFCRDSGVPLRLTYSCERGGVPPCGACLSCRDIESLGARP